MPELVIQGLPAGLVQEVGAGPRPTLGTCCMDEYPRCLGAEPYFMKRSLLSKPQVVVKAVLLVVEPNAKSGLHGLLLTSIRSVSIEGQVPGPRSQVPGSSCEEKPDAENQTFLLELSLDKTAPGSQEARWPTWLQPPHCDGTYGLSTKSQVCSL